MSAKAESTKSDDEEFSCGLLLRDIEEISKALYLHKGPLDAFNSTSDHRRNAVAKTGISESKSDVIIQDSLHKDKKSSIWNWNPIKALTHTRNHRFNCCFFLHVHAIEGLPPYFNKLNLSVTWKRKAHALRTRPAPVCLGMAEFEETLMHRCTISVGRTGLHSAAKYEPKVFLLHASVIGAPTLDIGSHWIDLTRFLPLTLKELAGDKSISGKWTTSFKLTGKARGASLNVSFGFSIYCGPIEPDYFAKVPDIAEEGGMGHFADTDISRTNQLHNLGSVPRMSSELANLNLLDEMLLKQRAELSHSVTLLYQRLDEKKMGNHMEFNLYNRLLESQESMSDLSHESKSVGGLTGHEFDDAEFDVIEQGIEVSEKDQIKSEKCSSLRFDPSVIETIDVAEIFSGEEIDFVENVEWNSNLDAGNCYDYACAPNDLELRDNITCITEPAFEGLDSTFYDLLTSKSSDLDSQLDTVTYNEHRRYRRSESSNRAQRLRRSLSLDDLELAESIENDFLNMLSIDQDQENIFSTSDQDQEDILSRDLLRHFEEDPLAWEGPFLNSNRIENNEEYCSFTSTVNGKVAFAADIDLSFPTQADERNHHHVNRSIKSKRNAEMLENLETEALMHEWGLSEKAFQYSPRVASGGFGSPVYLPIEEPLKLPPIIEGKGAIIRTTDGGLLRSMNPLLFRNANNGARLIVQVSAPVVFPSAMGSMAMEVLQCWARVGVEKMCFQANELMPLEDVSGKTIQQILAEAESGSDASNRWDVQQESDDVDSVVEKKAAAYLLYNGSSADLHSGSNMEHIGSDYVSIKDLVPMAVTNIENLLVEGLKIQSGMPDQEPPSRIRIHRAGNSTSSRKASETSSNFGSDSASGFQTLYADELIKCSLSLEEWLSLDSGQLNFGDDMLKLSAAHCAKSLELSSERLRRDNERLKLLDKSGSAFGDSFRMGLKVQLRDPMRNYEMVGAPMLALVRVYRLYEHMIAEGTDFKQDREIIRQPMFKVSEVHLSGFNVARHGNRPLWGTSRQHQSGSRWLLSSGMARSKKHLVSNCNAVIRSSSGLMKQAQTEDVLWSITLPVEGEEAATWDERIALGVHLRNPDILFPQESVY